MQPEIWLTPNIVIPTYFVYLSILYTSLILLLPRWARWQKRDVVMTLNLALIIMISGFIGARLMHVFYESPEEYRHHWSQLFYFWQGGYVFFGGAICAAFCCWLYIKLRRKQSFLSWGDFYAPIVALGYAFGRLGCLLAGCCYGKYCDVPWSIDGRHPTQIYAMIWGLFIFGVLVNWQKYRPRMVGQTFFTWIGLHSFGQLVIEFFRDDFRGPMIVGLSISTWISLFLIAGSLSYFSFRRLILRQRPRSA
jgi:phosphatidylglycerol---prolipoprotein diacylglyceryl transferase